MARTKTTAQLISRVRNLGEIRQVYVSDNAMIDEINQSRLELLEKLVNVGSADYFETSQNINIVANTESYALPTNYFTTLGVDIKLSNGDFWSAERYNLQDRNLLTNAVVYDREETRYRIRGENIVLSPIPNWSETNGIKHIYVAVPADLSYTNTAETCDGYWGWEDYIVYDVLVKLIGGKEEGDATEWQGLLAKANARIEEAAGRRDRANADTIANVDYEYRSNMRLRNV